MKADYLLEREVKLVLAALTPSNRLVAEVCLHTGLRVGDVVSLRAEQIGLQFMALERKTNKRRKVGLTADLLARCKAHSCGSEWVFPSRDGQGHRSRQAVWKDIKRASVAFRLPQNVAPHSLRKVYAVALLQKYGDLQRVKRALNHSGVEVTMIYAMADRLLEGRRASKKGTLKWGA